MTPTHARARHACVAVRLCRSVHGQFKRRERLRQHASPWYQPQTGQFTSVDPSFSETDQAYEYAGNDPINSSDPSGQFYICIGLFETIACSGGRSPSCHDWIGIGGYCATPPHQPVNGFSCFEGTVLAVAGGVPPAAAPQVKSCYRTNS